jgi:hypothetical protein
MTSPVGTGTEPPRVDSMTASALSRLTVAVVQPPASVADFRLRSRPVGCAGRGQQSIGLGHGHPHLISHCWPRHRRIPPQNLADHRQSRIVGVRRLPAAPTGPPGKPSSMTFSPIRERPDRFPASRPLPLDQTTSVLCHPGVGSSRGGVVPKRPDHRSWIFSAIAQDPRRFCHVHQFGGLTGAIYLG